MNTVLAWKTQVSFKVMKSLFKSFITYKSAMPCFQFHLCTHVHCQLCKREKKKKRPPISRVLSKQITITSPLTAPRNSFWLRQGLDETSGWQEHYCAVHTEHYSRPTASGTSCSTRPAAQMQHTTAHCQQPQPLLPSPVNAKGQGALKNTTSYHLCARPWFHIHSNKQTCPQKPEHTICKACHKIQEKWREGRLLVYTAPIGVSHTNRKYRYQ